MSETLSSVSSLGGDGAGGGEFFQEGTLVQVLPRVWPGINRPGGVGRVSKRYFDEEEDSWVYDVTYLVGGRDVAVPDCFIRNNELSSGPRQIRGRCRWCGSFVRDCQHSQTGPDPKQLALEMRQAQFISRRIASIEKKKTPKPMKPLHRQSIGQSYEESMAEDIFSSTLDDSHSTFSPSKVFSQLQQTLDLTISTEEKPLQSISGVEQQLPQNLNQEESRKRVESLLAMFASSTEESAEEESVPSVTETESNTILQMTPELIDTSLKRKTSKNQKSRNMKRSRLSEEVESDESVEEDGSLGGITVSSKIDITFYESNDLSEAKRLAAELHRRVYDCSLSDQTEDGIAPSSAGSRGELVSDEYQAALMEINNVSGAVAWELLYRASDFIRKRVVAADPIFKRSTKLLSYLRHLATVGGGGIQKASLQKALSFQVQVPAPEGGVANGEEWRKAVANDLGRDVNDEPLTVEQCLAYSAISVENESDILFRRIERVGFEVFERAEARLRRLLNAIRPDKKTDLRAAVEALSPSKKWPSSWKKVNRQRRHLSLVISGVSSEWSARLREARVRAQSIRRSYEDLCLQSIDDALVPPLIEEEEEEEEEVEEYNYPQEEDTEMEIVEEQGIRPLPKEREAAIEAREGRSRSTLARILPLEDKRMSDPRSLRSTSTRHNNTGSKSSSSSIVRQEEVIAGVIAELEQREKRTVRTKRSKEISRVFVLKTGAVLVDTQNLNSPFPAAPRQRRNTNTNRKSTRLLRESSADTRSTYHHPDKETWNLADDAAAAVDDLFCGPLAIPREFPDRKIETSRSISQRSRSDNRHSNFNTDGSLRKFIDNTVIDVGALASDDEAVLVDSAQQEVAELSSYGNDNLPDESVTENQKYVLNEISWESAGDVWLSLIASHVPSNLDNSPSEVAISTTNYRQAIEEGMSVQADAISASLRSRTGVRTAHTVRSIASMESESCQLELQLLIIAVSREMSWTIGRFRTRIANILGHSYDGKDVSQKGKYQPKERLFHKDILNELERDSNDLEKKLWSLIAGDACGLAMDELWKQKDDISSPRESSAIVKLRVRGVLTTIAIAELSIMSRNQNIVAFTDAAITASSNRDEPNGVDYYSGLLSSPINLTTALASRVAVRLLLSLISLYSSEAERILSERELAKSSAQPASNPADVELLFGIQTELAKLQTRWLNHWSRDSRIADRVTVAAAEWLRISSVERKEVKHDDVANILNIFSATNSHDTYLNETFSARQLVSGRFELRLTFSLIVGTEWVAKKCLMIRPIPPSCAEQVKRLSKWRLWDRVNQMFSTSSLIVSNMRSASTSLVGNISVLPSQLIGRFVSLNGNKPELQMRRGEAAWGALSILSHGLLAVNAKDATDSSPINSLRVSANWLLCRALLQHINGLHLTEAISMLQRISLAAGVWEAAYTAVETFIGAVRSIRPAIVQLASRTRLANIQSTKERLSSGEAWFANKSISGSKQINVEVSSRVYPTTSSALLFSTYDSASRIKRFSSYRSSDQSESDISSSRNRLHERCAVIVDSLFQLCGLTSPIRFSSTASRITDVMTENSDASIEYHASLSEISSSFRLLLLQAILTRRVGAEDVADSVSVARLKSTLKTAAANGSLVKLFTEAPGLASGSLLCLLAKEITAVLGPSVASPLLPDLHGLFVHTPLTADHAPASKLQPTSSTDEEDDVELRHRALLLLTAALIVRLPFPLPLRVETGSTPSSVVFSAWDDIENKLLEVDQSLTPLAELLRLLPALYVQVTTMSSSAEKRKKDGEFVTHLMFGGLSVAVGAITHATELLVTLDADTLVSYWCDKADDQSGNLPQGCQLSRLPMELVSATITLLTFVAAHAIEFGSLISAPINIGSASADEAAENARVYLGEIRGAVTHAASVLVSALNYQLQKVHLPLALALYRTSMRGTITQTIAKYSTWYTSTTTAWDTSFNSIITGLSTHLRSASISSIGARVSPARAAISAATSRRFRRIYAISASSALCDNVNLSKESTEMLVERVCEVDISSPKVLQALVADNSLRRDLLGVTAVIAACETCGKLMVTQSLRKHIASKLPLPDSLPFDFTLMLPLSDDTLRTATASPESLLPPWRMISWMTPAITDLVNLSSISSIEMIIKPSIFSVVPSVTWTELLGAILTQALLIRKEPCQCGLSGQVSLNCRRNDCMPDVNVHDIAYGLSTALSLILTKNTGGVPHGGPPSINTATDNMFSASGMEENAKLVCFETFSSIYAAAEFAAECSGHSQPRMTVETVESFFSLIVTTFVGNCRLSTQALHQCGTFLYSILLRASRFLRLRDMQSRATETTNSSVGPPQRLACLLATVHIPIGQGTSRAPLIPLTLVTQYFSEYSGVAIQLFVHDTLSALAALAVHRSSSNVSPGQAAQQATSMGVCGTTGLSGASEHALNNILRQSQELCNNIFPYLLATSTLPFATRFREWETLILPPILMCRLASELSRYASALRELRHAHATLTALRVAERVILALENSISIQCELWAAVQAFPLDSIPHRRKVLQSAANSLPIVSRGPEQSNFSQLTFSAATVTSIAPLFHLLGGMTILPGGRDNWSESQKQFREYILPPIQPSSHPNSSIYTSSTPPSPGSISIASGETMTSRSTATYVYENTPLTGLWACATEHINLASKKWLSTRVHQELMLSQLSIETIQSLKMRMLHIIDIVEAWAESPV